VRVKQACTTAEADFDFAAVKSFPSAIEEENPCGIALYALSRRGSHSLAAFCGLEVFEEKNKGKSRLKWNAAEHQHVISTRLPSGSSTQLS
jgi:hypothetical protein